MKRIKAFIILIFALLLPWRLRIMFAEFLGWAAQAVYWLPYALIRLIISKAVGGKEKKQTRSGEEEPR